MADGSKHENQTGPEAEQPSQVRLKWERSGDLGWVLHLGSLGVSVVPIDGGWSAMVEVPNAADCEEYFESLEDAKKYCEEKAKELLRKDLDRIGGASRDP